MPRNFDNWMEFNVNGKPFFGRFIFYKLHTTELTTITDESGTPLSNPMLSDEYGRTAQQVFLNDDENVTVSLEKFIGSGEMSDNMDNITAWEQVLTFDSMKNTVVIDIDGDIVFSGKAGTFEELRHLDPVTANYAMLYGYDELGDMPPVFYKSEYNTTEQDDGGSIARVDTTHIWRLIPPQIIDCRIFGIFPAPTIAELDTSRSQIHHWFTYANKLGKDVYMPKVLSTSAAYYLLYGGNETLRQKLIIDNNVHIVAKPNTTTKLTLGGIETEGSVLFFSEGEYGNVTVNCPEVKTSWKGNSWTAWPGTVKSVIVDGLNTAFEFDDANVTFTEEVSGKVLTFRNCLIESNHLIKNCVVNLDNCGVVTDAWFSGSTTAVFTGTNIVKLANMENPNTYIQWKNLLQEYNYGDMGENTISGVSLMAGSIIENVTLEGVYLASEGSYEMHNASGSVIANGDIVSLNLVDCWITLQNSSTSNTLKHIDLRRGSFTSSTVTNLTEACLFEDAVINSQIVTPFAKSTFKRCTINASISTFEVELIGCQVAAPIVTYALTSENKFKFRVEGNTFLQGGYHQLTSATADAQIEEGYWLDNDNLADDHFIYLNRSVLDADETHHNYVYEGNRGEYTLQKHAAKWSSTLNLQNSAVKGWHQYDDGLAFWYGGSGWATAGSPNATDINVYITSFKMFTVGTENVGDLVLTTTPPSVVIMPDTALGQKKHLMGSIAKTISLSNTERTISEYQAEQTGTPFRRGYMFRSDYEWRITGSGTDMFMIQSTGGISSIDPTERLLSNGIFQFKIEQM